MTIFNGLTIEKREYQISATKEIVSNIELGKSVLLNYPYGTGKTVIALLAFLHVKKQDPNAKFVFTSAREAAALRCRQALEMAKQFGFVDKLGYLFDPKTSGKGLGLSQRLKMYSASDAIFCPITTLMNDRFQMKSRLNVDILSKIKVCVIDEASDVVARSMTGYRLSKHFEELFQIRSKNGDFPILGLTGTRDLVRVDSILRFIGKNAYLMRQMDLSPYETITRIEEIRREDYIHIDQSLANLLTKPITTIQEILDPSLTRLEIIKLSYGGILDRLKSISDSFPVKIGKYQIMDSKQLQEVTTAFVRLFKLIHARLLLLESAPGEFLRYIKTEENRELFEEIIEISSKLISHRADFHFYDKPDETNTRGLIHPKIEKAMELIYDHLTRGAKILLFTRYIALGEQLHRLMKILHYPGVEFLSGKATEESRLRTINNFRNEDINVLIFTPVGGRGLNLAEADVVIHLDITSNLDEMTQRRERARGCLEYVLVLTGTSEDGKVQEYAKMNIKRLPSD